jgi:hypothetical protein
VLEISMTRFDPFAAAAAVYRCGGGMKDTDVVVKGD